MIIFKIWRKICVSVMFTWTLQQPAQGQLDSLATEVQAFNWPIEFIYTECMQGQRQLNADECHLKHASGHEGKLGWNTQSALA